MKITVLIENTSRCGMPVEHGLSLYLQKADGRTVLFDMGQSDLFAQNAKVLGLSISQINAAIVSHGHYDHGGGLQKFLELNQSAKVYIHSDAFQPHYSLHDTGLRSIGLDKKLKENPQIVPCQELTRLEDGMLLFANVQGSCCNPIGNRLLFGPVQDRNDDFHHEQNLILQEGCNTFLFAGCAHRGIVNILQRASTIIGHAPTHVFAGMHLVKSGLTAESENAFIQQLAQQLLQYENTLFYTMHCTGTGQFDKLRALMGKQMNYLSCGESIIIE